MKFFLGLIISVVIGSCTQKICTAKIMMYADSYKRYIIILEDSQRPRKYVTPKETNEAIEFLSIVSGISSKADRQHFISYKAKSDFKSDLKQWKSWYRSNRCIITPEYVDSAFKSVGAKVD